MQLLQGRYQEIDPGIKRREGKRVIIQIRELKYADIVAPLDTEDVTIRVVEKDGSLYGAWSEIKIPAKSYELLEEAIVEKWLENKKESI
jgi:hypothetical protein